MLKKAFIPRHEANRMKNEGGVEAARKIFLEKPARNLVFMLEKRFLWMNQYIGEHDTGIELGGGSGFSKYFIKCRNYCVSDLSDYPWLDHKGIDAMETGFENASFDFIVAENLIHHLSSPVKFLSEAGRILKPGGYLLIQETNASLMMRLLLRIMRHEGYSFDEDVFDQEKELTDNSDLWSANNAISNLLFDDELLFNKKMKQFSICRKTYSEFFILLNSGGMIAKTVYVPLPRFLLRVLDFADTLLTRAAPRIFALQRQIVLRKEPAE